MELNSEQLKNKSRTMQLIYTDEHTEHREPKENAWIGFQFNVHAKALLLGVPFVGLGKFYTVDSPHE